MKLFDWIVAIWCMLLFIGGCEFKLEAFGHNVIHVKTNGLVKGEK